MQMSEVSKPKPKLVQRFEDLLWANSPKSWVLKGLYFQNSLFISMLVWVSPDEPFLKVRRNFTLSELEKRSEDLWGMASDCVDEMKSEIKGKS
jgi:hypothetical protein